MSIEEQFGLNEDGAPLEAINESPEISEEQEAESEGEAYIEAEAEIEGEDAAQDEDSAEDDGVEEKPKRSKMIPRDRFDEVNEKAKQMEQEKLRLEWQLEQERLANKRLLGLAEDDSKEQSEDDEILDTALDKKYSQKFEQLEQKQIDTAIETELSTISAKVPELLDAHTHLIGALANQAAVRAKAAGYDFTPEQIYAYAKDQVDSELRIVKSRGGSAAEFIYQAAQASGYRPKAASQKKDSVVNMKEVNRLREEAGAPAIQRQSVKTGAADAIKAKIRAENKAAGIDETRSALFGL